MSVFKLQSLLTITIDTDNELTETADVTKILYIKPDGKTKGSWDASVSGKKLIYNLQDGDIDVYGPWQFQSYIESGGLKGFGAIVKQNFGLSLL